MVIFSHSRPDMTYVVDWALKANYLSIYLSSLSLDHGLSVNSSLSLSIMVFFQSPPLPLLSQSQVVFQSPCPSFRATSPAQQWPSAKSLLNSNRGVVACCIPERGGYFACHFLSSARQRAEGSPGPVGAGDTLTTGISWREAGGGGGGGG